MSQSIELPDPLYAEISGYATSVAASPLVIIRQAWDEFRHRHSSEAAIEAVEKPSRKELLAIVDALGGSISLPSHVDDDTLIADARMEKYGPL
jgi:hypothetical protein